MILKDLGIFLSMPPMLWCDNVFALALASNLIFHTWNKYIEVDYHYIRENILAKDLKVNFLNSLDQLANVFTKALSSPHFLDLAHKLMGVPPLSMRRDAKAHATSHATVVEGADTIGDKAAGKGPYPIG